MQLSPLTFTLATILIPYYQLNGLGFKKGVYVWCLMSCASCPGAPLVWLLFFEGLGLPSLVPSPLFSLNASLF